MGEEGLGTESLASLGRLRCFVGSWPRSCPSHVSRSRSVPAGRSSTLRGGAPERPPEGGGPEPGWSGDVAACRMRYADFQEALVAAALHWDPSMLVAAKDRVQGSQCPGGGPKGPPQEVDQGGARSRIAQ